MKKLICNLLFAFVIMANGFSQSIIDLHSHAITEDYLQFLQSNNALMDEGFPIPSWDVNSHLDFMEKAGIETSVLTMVAPHPYFGNTDQTIKVVRQFNEYCAGLKEKYKGKFKFCAALPLPDINAAIKEIRYAFDTLHADGVKLATNVCGQYLGDKELDTIFSVLNEYHALIIIHPHRPSNYSSQLLNSLPLALYEYPAETSRAVCNMIARNVLARYDKVRLVVPHSGAYLPLAIKRMQNVYPVFRNKGLMQEIDFEKNLSRLWFDLAGNASTEIIKTMLSITTIDHILYGSDYPYVNSEVLIANANRFRQQLQEDFTLAPFAKMILSENARSLFDFNYKTQPLNMDSQKFLVRIAEISVEEKDLDKYLQYGKEIASVSLEKEKGVICLLPMQIKEEKNQIRIIEIYKDENAYQHHIKTDHFLKYKKETADMVKSLKLIDMQLADPSSLSKIFEKL